jgi:hypothetical protein
VLALDSESCLHNFLVQDPRPCGYIKGQQLFMTTHAATDTQHQHASKQAAQSYIRQTAGDAKQNVPNQNKGLPSVHE